MKKVILLLALLFLSSGCSVNTIYHDEDQAISTTNLFLKNIIKQDYSTAYDYIGDRLKEELSFEKFESDLKQGMQVRGNINKAVFDSFQPVPGQKAIQLYYNVYHEDAEPILYHFVLEGDGKEGYRIILVDVGNQMDYPPNMKYAGVERIRKNQYIVVTGN